MNQETLAMTTTRTGAAAFEPARYSTPLIATAGSWRLREGALEQ